VKIKTPWITAEERKRMEILVVDIERCIQHYPHREAEYAAQLRNLRSELEFDK
jgi:hypothetical protein